MRPDRTTLRSVAALFLRLGATAFGGPAAHIAMMRHEVVGRLGWMDEQDFLDHVGACSLIPGPSSTELAIAIGAQRAGWRGLVLAGVCFILPAFLIVLGIAELYRRYGTTPALEDLRWGVLPVVLAIIVTAVVQLGRAALRRSTLWVVAVATVVAYRLRVPVPLILVGAALVPIAVRALRRRPPGGLAALAAAVPPDLWGLFKVFAKIGALLFGSGYVLVAFLQQELVQQRGWLTEQQLLDAVTVGQLTPGPVFTTATFIGDVLLGVPGAIVATVAIFLPAFVFVAFLPPFVAWMRRTPWARAGLDGVNAAAVGLMVGVVVDLAPTALPDALAAGIAAAATVVLVRTRVSPSWLVVAGAGLGLLHAVAT